MRKIKIIHAFIMENILYIADNRYLVVSWLIGSILGLCIRKIIAVYKKMNDSGGYSSRKKNK